MNIPNILSCLRIILIPVTAYFFYADNITLAALVFVLACLTDIADGFIARRYNMITDLGKILDPLADKGMQITVLVSMAACSLMPWAVVIFIICKEFLMCTGGALLYRSRVVIGANWYGKMATVVTSVCVTLILVFYEYLGKCRPVLILLQWLPIIFAIFAFLGYMAVYIKIRTSGDENEQ